MKPFSLACLAVLATLFTGCMAGAGYTLKDRITEAALDYNNGVRWGQLDQAAQHVPLERRQRFVDRHKSLEDELEIADCEMVHLEIDNKNDRATARVEYTWSLKHRGIVEKTATDQKWEHKDGVWIVASEVRVKGAHLVLFEEALSEGKPNTPQGVSADAPPALP